MDKQTLLDRISNKEQQIEKLNRRIKKWENQCTNEEISIADSFRDNYSKFAAHCKQFNLGTSFTPMSELRSAYSDLDDATVILNKYKNQLNIIIDKESIEKIEIFVEFLDKYKKEIIRYVERNIDSVIEYYRLNNEYCEFHNNRRRIIRSGEMTEEEWREELKLKRLKEEELKDSIKMSNGYAVLMDIFNNKADFSYMPKGMKTPKLANCKRLNSRRSVIIDRQFIYTPRQLTLPLAKARKVCNFLA